MSTKSACGKHVVLLVLAVITTLATTRLAIGQHLYWSDTTADKIKRARLDGSDVEEIVTNVGGVTGIAIDADAGQLYWTDAAADAISRSNLDGSNIVRLVDPGLSQPRGIALDLINGKMYWADAETNKVQRANLDGTAVEDMASSLGFPVGVALDVTAGHLYWTDQARDVIQRSDLDGLQVVDVLGIGLNAPTELVLDVFAGKMYWTDNASLLIKRANLDGSSVESLIDLPPTSGSRGIALDLSARKIYWSDGLSSIQRANLDGSQVELIVTGAEIGKGAVALDLGCDAGGPDCQPNGVPDICDLESGASLDCNGNGVPDACDLADGSSEDCDSSGVPDECETDCNNNGIADTCDLTNGTSDDCNTNSVPDECDIAGESSPDCNGNGVPDECDVSSGTSVDCNNNNVPDECERDEDCNGNGEQDLCDIFDGVSADCNFDLVPDECQPDEDCNKNGTRDICDIGAGSSKDCNANLAPDECDLVDGTSVDEDGDGRPDECCFLSSAPVPLTISDDSGVPYVLTAGRFLIFTAGDPGRNQALRVAFQFLPVPFDAWNGAQLWVGPTTEVSENGATFEPIPGFGTFSAATLQCEPFFANWSDVGTIHVFHEGVVPGAVFDIQVIDEFCDSASDASFSGSLVLSTAIFGDVVDYCGVCDSESPPDCVNCTPPDGSVGILDVFAIINRFVSASGAPRKPRTELEPACLDLVSTISDVLQGINGFAGLPYSFEPSADDPCQSTCVGPLP